MRIKETANSEKKHYICREASLESVAMDLEEYIELFSHLRTSQSKGLKAPHKAVFLMSVAKLIKAGKITTTCIEYTTSLERTYNDTWSENVQIATSFVCDVRIPYVQMDSEPFCRYEKTGLCLDADLFEFLRNPESCATLMAILDNIYLSPFHFEHRVHFDELNPYKDDKLRPYQTNAKKEIYKMWEKKHSVMLQMPTGTGKTRLFVSITRDLVDWGARHKMAIKVLILAHRKELLNQISKNVGLNYGLAHGNIRSGSIEARELPIQVGSVPTLVRRLDKWEDKKFDIIIVDEAHHVKAESYKKIIRTFPTAKILGVTATPYRMSHESFHPEFEDLIVSPPVSAFIKQGYLSNYDYYSIAPDSQVQNDINSINRFALDGDYLDEAMADVMDRDEIRAGIVSSYMQLAKGKKGIVYTINKAHNMHVCEDFIAHGVKAVAIDSDTSAETRDRMEQDFKNGKIDVICNVNIFSEGYDCPDVECIQLARPTKSLSMYLQQVGRGLRPAENKTSVTIIDNVGLYNRFGFPSARRKWRYHFEGKYIDYNDEDEMDLEDLNEHEIHFIEPSDYDFEEGNDVVEMLHSSVDESVAVEELPQKKIELFQEDEYRFYLHMMGLQDEEITKVLKYTKNELDGFIRKNFYSKHVSVLAMDDRGLLELYLRQYRFDVATGQTAQKDSDLLIEALATYVRYLDWKEKDRPEVALDGRGVFGKLLKRVNERTVEDVLQEIELLSKYGNPVPEELLNEYRRLTQK